MVPVSTVPVKRLTGSRLNPGVRVVLASGYSREEVAERFAGRGLAGVIQKPFSLDTLRETMATLMPARDK